MGFVALALSHVQPHDVSGAGLRAVTLEMITYRSKWSVQTHFDCNISCFHKQKGFLQPAVTKYASSSTNATKAAPVHAEPALQLEEPVGTTELSSTVSQLWPWATPANRAGAEAVQDNF